MSAPTRIARAAGHDAGETPLARPLAGRIVVVLLLGGSLGLGLTYEAVEHRLDPSTVQLGPWSVWPKAGGPDSDPYARAILARRGEIAMASAEGTLLIAKVDQEGRALRRECDYRVEGKPQPARFWTIGVETVEGAPMPNAADRFAFSSAEVLRGLDGSFAIEAAPRARPGNWLPLSGSGPFILWLRFYDGAWDAHGRTAATLPVISRRACPAP